MVIERLHVILAPQVLSITSFQNPLQNVPLYTHKCTMSQYGLQISPNSVDDLIALLVIICSGFSLLRFCGSQSQYAVSDPESSHLCNLCVVGRMRALPPSSFLLPSAEVISEGHSIISRRTHQLNQRAPLRKPIFFKANDRARHRHSFSKACWQHSQTVIQPCMWFMEEPSQFSGGQTAQSLTCSIMDEPHTGLEDCLRMLLSCFRKRMSGA